MLLMICILFVMPIDVSGAAGVFAFDPRRAILGSMKQARSILNLVVAATLTFTSTGAFAQDMDALLQQLADPANDRWQRVQRQILRDWEDSGSAALDYIFQRGKAALDAGDAETAVDHFSFVLERAPDFAQAWAARANAYYLANRLGQSLSDIQQALRLNPFQFNALAGLGAIFEQLDQPERALAAYHASLTINPHQQAVIEAVSRLALASQGTAL